MSKTVKIIIAVAVITGLAIGLNATVAQAGNTTFGCIKNPACLYNTPKPPQDSVENKNQG